MLRKKLISRGTSYSQKKLQVLQTAVKRMTFSVHTGRTPYHNLIPQGLFSFFKMAADREKTLANAGLRDIKSTNGEPSTILN